MFKLIIYTFTLVVVMADEVYFAPSIFLNHGGGPYPVLGEKYNKEIAESLKNISSLVKLDKLKAIIVVTAHREENVVTISSGERHSLVYDYSNFPPESYDFKYDAPGDPTLARRINDAFKNAGIQSALDEKRGWDHGVFIPMMLINPKANIPVIQVSILKNQDAFQHYQIGKVLFEFRKESVAIFGSGMSYHNMKEFHIVERELFGGNTSISSWSFPIDNEKFDGFLSRVCVGDEDLRRNIIFWDEQEGGLDSHPRGEADHLMPLIVNVGASGTDMGKKIFKSVFLLKFKLSGFVWGGEIKLAI